MNLLQRLHECGFLLDLHKEFQFEKNDYLILKHVCLYFRKELKNLKYDSLKMKSNPIMRYFLWKKNFSLFEYLHNQYGYQLPLNSHQENVNIQYEFSKQEDNNIRYKFFQQLRSEKNLFQYECPSMEEMNYSQLMYNVLKIKVKSNSHQKEQFDIFKKLKDENKIKESNFNQIFFDAMKSRNLLICKYILKKKEEQSHLKEFLSKITKHFYFTQYMLQSSGEIFRYILSFDDVSYNIGNEIKKSITTSPRVSSAKRILFDIPKNFWSSEELWILNTCGNELMIHYLRKEKYQQGSNLVGYFLKNDITLSDNLILRFCDCCGALGKNYDFVFDHLNETNFKPIYMMECYIKMNRIEEATKIATDMIKNNKINNEIKIGLCLNLIKIKELKNQFSEALKDLEMFSEKFPINHFFLDLLKASLFRQLGNYEMCRKILTGKEYFFSSQWSYELNLLLCDIEENKIKDSSSISANNHNLYNFFFNHCLNKYEKGRLVYSTLSLYYSKISEKTKALEFYQKSLKYKIYTLEDQKYADMAKKHLKKS